MKRLQHGITKFLKFNSHRLLRGIIFRPNLAVKGTRRTQALLKVSGLIGFVGFALVLHPARPLL
jgi:hypothetical protein